MRPYNKRYTGNMVNILGEALFLISHSLIYIFNDSDIDMDTKEAVG